jgi:hypothetical protein
MRKLTLKETLADDDEWVEGGWVSFCAKCGKPSVQSVGQCSCGESQTSGQAVWYVDSYALVIGDETIASEEGDEQNDENNRTLSPFPIME